MKEKCGQLDIIKIYNFCLVKDITKRLGRQVTGWEKIHRRPSSKGLLPSVYKELLNFNNKETNNLPKKMSKRPEQPPH